MRIQTLLNHGWVIESIQPNKIYAHQFSLHQSQSVVNFTTLDQETTLQLSAITVETPDNIELFERLPVGFDYGGLLCTLFATSIHLEPLVATIMNILPTLLTVETRHLLRNHIAKLDLLVVFAFLWLQGLLSKSSECCDFTFIFGADLVWAGIEGRPKM